MPNSSDLELLKLFRQEEDNFKRHLELKDNEIINLRLLLNRNGTDQGDQTIDVDQTTKSSIDESQQLRGINQILSIDSDSFPLKVVKTRISKTLPNNISLSDYHRDLVEKDAQTDKVLALSLLSVFAKELNQIRREKKSTINLNMADLNDKYNTTLKHLNYQMQVNADIKKLIVESVIGSQISNNYSFWGSDPDIQKNVLDLYNDALVRIGQLSAEMDALKSENDQLNQILEDFLMATID